MTELTAKDFVEMYLGTTEGAPMQGHYPESIHCRMKRPSGLAKDSDYRCPRCDAEAIAKAPVEEVHGQLVDNLLALPAGHRKVIEEAVAEALRNAESGDPDTQTEADVAADVAQRLVDIYGFITVTQVTWS